MQTNLLVATAYITEATERNTTDGADLDARTLEGSPSTCAAISFTLIFTYVNQPKPLLPSTNHRMAIATTQL